MSPVLVENELSKLLKKYKLLSTNNYSFFLGRMYFSSNDGSQNISIYQPKFNASELKKEKDNEYVIGWKSKGIYIYIYIYYIYIYI